MEYSLRRTPEAAGQPGRVLVLAMDPARIRLCLSVQSAWNHGQGIIRGLRENGALVEDHIREQIDDSGRLRDAGRRIFGDEAMRRQVWTVERHHAPFNDVAAVTGNGNLLANPHFIAWQDGTLYHLAGEPLASRCYTCLVVRGTAVSIEPFTEDCDFATYGQQIVRAGRAITRNELVAKALAGEFYDLRHLLLFPRIDIAAGRWIDPGLDSIDVAAALREEPVTADVSAFDEAEVRRALARKGYTRYELRAGRLTYVPQPGIYPHHIIGLTDSGMILDVVIDGLSNRVGCSIPEAADMMIQLGARDALILDNGSDVMLRYRGLTALDGRSRLRSVLLYRSPTGYAGRISRLEG